MLSAEKAKTLYDTAEKAKHLNGEFWDIGCNAGGSAATMKLAAPRKQVRLFDSFQGLPPNCSEDSRENEPGRFTAKYEENLWILGEVYKGWVPDTFVGLEQHRIALAHIDLDLYQGTKDALHFVLPRIVQDGYIIVDDYNSAWKGVTVAVNEVVTSEFEKTPVVQDQIILRKI